ncbi:uncharacterized protein LOC143886655 isoform X2 [Tasmannia lanceolata]|uniref:uncharacterized protein LOC143886655 isoform X2 n=1 Tax=Tasmannia lanceolata TaxID=3420 RepID=UPI004063D3BB
MQESTATLGTQDHRPAKSCAKSEAEAKYDRYINGTGDIGKNKGWNNHFVSTRRYQMIIPENHSLMTSMKRGMKLT